MSEQATVAPAQSPDLGHNPDLFKNTAAAVVKGRNPQEIARTEGTINRIYEDKGLATPATELHPDYAAMDSDTAEQVAYAVKADGDAVADLQKRIDNPFAHAAEMTGPDGKPSSKFIGVEDTKALELQRKAAKIDFERNAEEAAHAAKMLGHLAVRGK